MIKRISHIKRNSILELNAFHEFCDCVHECGFRLPNHIYQLHKKEPNTVSNVSVCLCVRSTEISSLGCEATEI